MIGIRILITRYISDDPQPGIVECELIDAAGVKHYFTEKTAIVTKDFINADSDYPREGIIACEIVNQEFGPDVIEVGTERPWYVESTEGLTRFRVNPALVGEW